MRLLNVRTRQLSEFCDLQMPRYSILSHCWGSEEVTYQEISVPVLPSTTLSEPAYKDKAGYTKINSACIQSLKDGLDWLWIDTCCIDKSSSAELSESINSMFRWYENSVVCYALLEDMDDLVFFCGPDEKPENFVKGRQCGYQYQRILTDANGCPFGPFGHFLSRRFQSL
jgi:hypothetical protein